MLVWAKKVSEDGERGKTEYQHAVQGIDHDGRIDQAHIPAIERSLLRAQMASCALPSSAEGVAHRKGAPGTFVARTAKVVDIYAARWRLRHNGGPHLLCQRAWSLCWSA